MSDTNDLPKLVFVVPDENQPGYLDRMLSVAGFSEMLDTNKLTKSGMNDMLSFLADYVKEPADKAERIKLLRMASEAEIKGLLEALANTGKVNPTNGGS